MRHTAHRLKERWLILGNSGFFAAMPWKISETQDSARKPLSLWNPSPELGWRFTHLHLPSCFSKRAKPRKAFPGCLIGESLLCPKSLLFSRCRITEDRFVYSLPIFFFFFLTLVTLFNGLGAWASQIPRAGSTHSALDFLPLIPSQSHTPMTASLAFSSRI